MAATTRPSVAPLLSSPARLDRFVRLVLMLMLIVMIMIILVLVMVMMLKIMMIISAGDGWRSGCSLALHSPRCHLQV